MTSEEQSVLDILGFQDLGPQEQEEMLLAVGELIFKGSVLRMISQMDEATKESFDALLATDPEEEAIQAFLSEHVPDADKAVIDTVEELKSDILAVTGASQD